MLAEMLRLQTCWPYLVTGPFCAEPGRCLSSPCSCPFAAAGAHNRIVTEETPHRPLSWKTRRPLLNPDVQPSTIGCGILFGSVRVLPTCTKRIKSTSGTIGATSIVPPQVLLSALTRWTYINSVFRVKRFGGTNFAPLCREFRHRAHW